MSHAQKWLSLLEVPSLGSCALMFADEARVGRPEK
jgi:hypothetical protein